ncbi:hypothetical protein [Cupriavidus sp. UYPR2.512]|uniref:hypothetical protein n=1 Tax=Cupriavidus sp. UYPR2.512 TaxID=1080187 RepID=UPI00037E7CD2|nr:hypothetical protein [Cupriavidus sp. UYPR2.512]UIF89418.1 hypothetical protein KAF44_29550 [Cupriavidus necator]
MNVKSIYAAPSTFDRAIAAVASAGSAFSNGLWIPFAAIWSIGIMLWLGGYAQSTHGYAELYQIGGQAALDGYFATVKSANLTMFQMMSDGLSGHSIMIGGVLKGWGLFIAFAVTPVACVASLAGAMFTAYVKQGSRSLR